VVPDQLKSAVSRPCRYEPEVQRTFKDWADHMGTVIIPARPKKPRDKAKVEVGVQIVQRWILAKIRNETFFSLEALNDRIAELLEELNGRPMRAYGNRSRRDLFEAIERCELKPLPAKRFTYVEWLQPRVNIDYHIDVKKHYYSVPHQLVHERVDVRLSSTTVEVFRKGNRVWVHQRSYKQFGYTTVKEHMPKSHRAHSEWSPSRLIRWGSTVGPQTEELIKQILRDRPHPEQGYRSCLGILRLSKRYGEERLEAAAARAVAVGARSYRHVDSILKNGMDRLPVEEESGEAKSPIVHDNLRGPNYYKKKGGDG
jgi:transposase